MKENCLQRKQQDLKITSSVIQGLERDGVVRQISRVQYRNPFAGKFNRPVYSGR